MNKQIKDIVEPGPRETDGDDLDGQVDELSEKLSDLAGSVQDKTQETFDDVKNKTSAAVEQMKSQMKVKYDETADAVAEKASDAIDFAKDKYEDSKEATKNFLASGLQAGISGLDKTLEALESSAFKFSPLLLVLCLMLFSLSI